jgi:polysaccharide pyruvyl transferase WcaK-like protein
MSILRELRKSKYRIKSYVDFFSPQHAVFGPFATGNLGDNAALYAYRQIMSQEFQVITAQTYYRIPNNLKSLVIGLGGCLNKDTPSHVLKFERIFSKKKFPFLMISGGINCDLNNGSYKNYFDSFLKILHYMDYVSTREEMSADFLYRLGYKKEIRIIPDLVLSLKAPDVSLNCNSRDGIGFVFASHNSLVCSKKFFNEIAQVFTFFLKKGMKVYCIPFQIDTFTKYKRAINEVETARRFKREFDFDSRVVILDNMMTPEKTLDFFSKKLHCIISARLHGNVFAARSGIPFIALSYNKKIDAFVQMMQLERFSLKILEKNLNDKIKEIFKEIETSQEVLREIIPEKADQLSLKTKSELERIKLLYFNLS